MGRHLLVLCAVPLLLPGLVAGQQDIDGSADHPMFSRYEGSRIVGYDHRSYDRYTLALGPALEGSVHSKPFEIEGEVTRILYVAPEGRAPLEVFRNYQRALSDAGFEELFHCTGNGCGRLFKYIQPHGSELVPYAFKGFTRDWEYLAAKGMGPDGEVYVALHTAVHESPVSWMEQRTLVRLDVVELEGMDEDMVTVDAEGMRDDIAAQGKAVLYGILFETDRADLRAESDAVLQEIATLLTDNPHLSLAVVGHTDAEGALAYNLDLSARRAEAVRAALTSRFGVSASRLSAHGVGPLAPVATNTTENGRALNRRVELVPIR